MNLCPALLSLVCLGLSEAGVGRVWQCETRVSQEVWQDLLPFLQEQQGVRREGLCYVQMQEGNYTGQVGCSHSAIFFIFWFPDEGGSPAWVGGDEVEEWEHIWGGGNLLLLTRGQVCASVIMASFSHV